MSVSLTAVLKLQDNLTSPLKRAMKQTEAMGDVATKASNKLSLITTSMSGIVAAGAPVAAMAGGLAASFAGAGISAVAFGTVATSVLGDIFEASEEVAKIEEKIAQADTWKEKANAQKELAAVYADMSTAQKGALKDLQSFKSFWGDFTQQFEEPIFQAFSQGLQATQGLLKGLAPTISNVATVVTDMMTRINQSMEGSAMKQFFTWLEVNGARSLSNFATIAGNTMSGFFSILQAFAPIGAQMEGGLVRLTEKFKTWAASLGESNGFKQFVEYSKQNGPVLMDTLGNIGDLIKGVVQTLAPLGSVVLRIVNVVTQFKELIIAVGAAVLTYKTITTAMAAAQWALNVAMNASPIGLVITAIAALVAVGVLLYRNWDTIKGKALDLWNAIKKAWTNVANDTKRNWERVRTGISNAMDRAREKVSAFFSPLLSFIGKAKSLWDGLVSKIKNFKMPKINFPSLPSWGGGDKADGRHYHGISKIPRNNYRAVLHKGERVLSASENKEYSKGNGTGNGVTINLYGMTIREEADIDRVANLLAAKIKAAGSAGAGA